MLKLSPAQLQELQAYEVQLKAILAQRERFIQYLLREHGSEEKGPFSLVGDSLVPQSTLPPAVKL